MAPKYTKGNKVRIKSRSFMERTFDPAIGKYENMVGEVIESVNVVAFVAKSRDFQGESSEQITIYQYSVKLDDEVILHNILEDFLESTE